MIGNKGLSRMHVILVAVVVVIIVAGAFAYVLMTPPAQPGEKVIIVRNEADPGTLNPIRTSYEYAVKVFTNIYSGLLRYEPGNPSVINPDLAESYEISPDGKTWTFHLREGVTFHNGYGELTAEDCVFTFEKYNDTEYQSVWVSTYEVIDKLEAVDTYTFRVTLKEPSASFLAYMVSVRSPYIVSKKAVEALGDDVDTNPIGTGPFVFESWTPSDEVILIANEDFYGGRPKIDKIIYKVIVEEVTANAALELGEIDIQSNILTADSLRRFEDDPNINVFFDSTSTLSFWLAFNTQVEPFNNSKVRAAMQHALDRDAIIDAIFEGMARPNPTFLPSQNLGWTNDSAKIPIYEYDVEKAKNLLAEAGYADGFRTTLFGHNAVRQHEVWVACQNYWKEIGVNVELVIVDTTYWQSVMFKPGIKEYPMMAQGIGRPDPDLTATFCFGWESAYQAVGYNETWNHDDLIASGRSEFDLAKRAEIYEDLQKAILDDAVIIPMYYPISITATRTQVKGWTGDTSLTLGYMFGVDIES